MAISATAIATPNTLDRVKWPADQVAGHHHLGLNLPGVPMAVRGDKTRLVQAVSNLLSNAAKYTPPSTSSGVSASDLFDD